MAEQAGFTAKGDIVRCEDGHAPPVYRAVPKRDSRANIIVVQEIFGVTPHIRTICDRLAGRGYTAVAPDLFSRDVPETLLPYTKAGKDRGLAIKNAIGEDRMARDVMAVAGSLAAENGGRTGVIGFCLGGTVAWLAAAQPGIACAVGYYSVKIDAHLGSKPACPVLLHFGRTDTSIPMSAVEAVRAAYPEVDVQDYDAGHAFNRDDDVSFNPQAAATAWRRTLDFLGRNLALA